MSLHKHQIVLTMVLDVQRPEGVEGQVQHMSYMYKTCKKYTYKKVVINNSFYPISWNMWFFSQTDK